MEMSRVWAMPNHNTFEIKPIRRFVEKYLANSRASIDPFARNSQLATVTNDLNPATSATYHLTAKDFLTLLWNRKVYPDLVIMDPPYNLSQLKQCYQDVGREFAQWDAQYGASWIEERDIIKEILTNDGVVLTFGWNTNGMGKARGFEIVEIMLVSHGGQHNDTICIAEKRIDAEVV